MIGMRGSAALDTCFNAVALSFVLEIDNFAYDHIINEKTRKEFEEACRVQITSTDSVMLDRSRKVYMALTPCACFYVLVGYATDNLLPAFMTNLLCFSLFAHIVELLVGSALVTSKLQGCLEGLLKFMIGFVAMFGALFLVETF